MNEIIIIGAGHGGIVTSIKLAEIGYHVTIFEKTRLDDIGYDFSDVFEIDCFNDLNLLIKKESFQKKDDMTFISPNLKNRFTPKIPDEFQEYRMERKTIYKYLLSLVKNPNITIIDNKKINDFIINDNHVTGVISESGEKYLCDLVIDSAGYIFDNRKKLPHYKNSNYLNENGDFLYAYRATYIKNEDTVDKYKVYLYPIGIRGIAWVVCLNNEIDILIGSVDPLEKESIDKALNFLQRENSCLGKELIRGGDIHYIPINKPLSRFFCKGYALIGDGANMTIPLIGSGITNSIVAGLLLAESIKKYGIIEKALWDYQYNYMIKRGWEDTSLNCLKRLLLNLDSKSIDFLFDKKIVTGNDFLICCAGRELKLKFNDLINRGVRGLGNIKLLLKFAKAYYRSRYAIRLIKRMPYNYNELKIEKYIKKYNKL